MEASGPLHAQQRSARRADDDHGNTDSKAIVGLCGQAGLHGGRRFQSDDRGVSALESLIQPGSGLGRRELDAVGRQCAQHGVSDGSREVAEHLKTGDIGADGGKRLRNDAGAMPAVPLASEHHVQWPLRGGRGGRISQHVTKVERVDPVAHGMDPLDADGKSFPGELLEDRVTGERDGRCSAKGGPLQRAHCSSEQRRPQPSVPRVTVVNDQTRAARQRQGRGNRERERRHRDDQDIGVDIAQEAQAVQPGAWSNLAVDPESLEPSEQLSRQQTVKAQLHP
jgi:hypothetical protein